MANHAMLNNVDHKDLRVATGRGADLGDDVMYTLALPCEFRSITADYPILFHRNGETGKYVPVVMFGFERGENLFLEGNQWHATYIPLMIQRGPFLIGFQGVAENDSTRKKMVISIDMDNPRVGASDGEPLFQPFGGNSEYTDQIVDVLQEIESGRVMMEEFVDALLEHDLLEPVTLDVELDSGAKHSLRGFHTVHEERLAALDGVVLADFSRRGILQACYLVVASMANIGRLIQLKNKRA